MGKPYAIIEVAFDENKKLLRAPRKHRNAVLGLYVRGLLYCQEHLTDGFIPDGLFDSAEDEPIARLLIERCGFWDRVDDGVVIHDYLSHNRSREQVEAISAKKSEAGRRGAQIRWHGAKSVPSTTHSTNMADGCTTLSIEQVKTTCSTGGANFGTVSTAFETAKGSVLSSSDIDRVSGWCRSFPEGVILQAIKDASAAGKVSAPYVGGIIKRIVADTTAAAPASPEEFEEWGEAR